MRSLPWIETLTASPSFELGSLCLFPTTVTVAPRTSTYMLGIGLKNKTKICGIPHIYFLMIYIFIYRGERGESKEGREWNKSNVWKYENMKKLNIQNYIISYYFYRLWIISSSQYFNFSGTRTHTHTHTHIYIYIYILVGFKRLQSNVEVLGKTTLLRKLNSKMKTGGSSRNKILLTCWYHLTGKVKEKVPWKKTLQSLVILLCLSLGCCYIDAENGMFYQRMSKDLQMSYNLII